MKYLRSTVVVDARHGADLEFCCLLFTNFAIACLQSQLVLIVRVVVHDLDAEIVDEDVVVVVCWPVWFLEVDDSVFDNVACLIRDVWSAFSTSFLVFKGFHCLWAGVLQERGLMGEQYSEAKGGTDLQRHVHYPSSFFPQHGTLHLHLGSPLH